MESNKKNNNNLSRSEVIRRLRLRNQPATYFGESDADRLARLQYLEEREQKDYEDAQRIQELETKKRKLEEEREKEEEQAAEETFKKMTPQQQRLFELRGRLNKSRRANLEAAVLEEKNKINPKATKSEIWKKKQQQKKIRREKAERGEDGAEEADSDEEVDDDELPEEEVGEADKDYLNITAEVAEKINERWKKKKKPAPTGWEVFSQDAVYRSYKKRSQKAAASMKEYIKQKEQLGEEVFYAGEESQLEFGKFADSTQIPEANKDRMADELRQQMERRKKFSRRRAFNPNEDIDYINDRNRQFNEKISRAFDKYTAEIKQNLERGTAV
eukprot:GEZU01004150.1.p1 GENE.GEZU01004150.1~~GEZU01004150.1.p1  ORF type:complete len:330 (-),score=159.40 GEZU01004150.1:63-1052(-)